MFEARNNQMPPILALPLHTEATPFRCGLSLRIANIHLEQIFFCVFEGETDVSVFLSNSQNNDKEKICKTNNPSVVRKELIELISKMFPLNKCEFSKKYCYPKDKNI